MKKNFKRILWVVLIAVCGGDFVLDATGQDLVNSSVFVFSRPKSTTKEGSGSAVKGDAGKYKKSNQLAQRKRKAAAPKRLKSTIAETKVNVEANDKLGVTLWRLRPEKKSDEGARILTMGDGKDASSKMVAERVALDTEFKMGEKVRFSVESPQTGYLYIIDRERHTDGTLGEAKLIFPTSRTNNGNNKVFAGKVIEIPSQSDSQSYFDITPNAANYAGELITVIFTEKEIKGLQIGPEPLDLTASWINDWENKWERKATTFELTGTRSLYTDDEKAAGEGTRQLTQSSAAPQTFISIEKQAKDTAFLVSFPIKVAKQ
ncbi:MAG: DUF4384 domain-containing protein [Pyrinomonadaceae bacterium]